jgi:hypothetical protein
MVPVDNVLLIVAIFFANFNAGFNANILASWLIWLDVLMF